ncbi:hypothetical protein ACFQYP_15655 [Nonomuraea antimicrobica]
MTPFKEELYRHRPLPREPVAGPIAEGGLIRYLEHAGEWRRVHTGADGLVDWSEFCFTPEYRVALAATVLEVDQAEWRTLRLASTGPTLLFVNGELVDESDGFTYMEPAERARRVWLPSGTSTVVVASWQVAFRECRQVLRLRVDGLPVRVVVPGAGASEDTAAVAERLLEAVGVTRWGTTDGTVPITGPDGVALRVRWAEQERLVRLTGGRATLRLDQAGGGQEVGNASMLSTGETVLRVSVDGSPVFRSSPSPSCPLSTAPPRTAIPPPGGPSSCATPRAWPAPRPPSWYAPPRTRRTSSPASNAPCG